MSRTLEYYSPFFTVDGGVNNYFPPSLIANNELQSASNIFIKNKRLYKRPGKSLYGPTFATGCKGICEFTDSIGITYLIVASNSHLYYVHSDDKHDLGAITDEVLHFEASRGTLFINGSATQKKQKITTISDVGIVSPSSAPTAVIGGGAGLTGSYAWKCTYVIGADEYESNPSSVSNTLNLVNQDATITPPVSPDSRVTCRRIYRTTAGGNKWYYEGIILNNTLGATFTSGAVSDVVLTADVGNLVESTHGQPDQGQFCSVCNGIAFRLKGTNLYYSEIGKTYEYLEYQSALNNIKLLGSGDGTGLKSLYNPNTGKEDLYIFQNSLISILPNGDPTQSLYLISDDIGCVSHDTICRFKNKLFFLSNKGSVCYVQGGIVVDVSTLNIKKTVEDIISPSSCTAAIVFNNYYALCSRNDSTKLYNTYVIVIDLTTIQIVDELNGLAKATPFFWNLNAQYMIQRNDGTVLFFDNQDLHLYELSADNSQDSDTLGNLTDIPDFWFQCKSHGGANLFDLVRAEQLRVLGTFEKNVNVIPYAMTRSSESVILPVSGSSFIMGVSEMGDEISDIPQMNPVDLPEDCAAQGLSFRFTQDEKDIRFEFIGYMYTNQTEKEGK